MSAWPRPNRHPEKENTRMSKTKSKSEKASGKSPEQAPVAAPATRLGDAEAQARLAVLRAQMEKQYGKGIIQNLSDQISNQRFASPSPSLFAWSCFQK